MRTLLQQRADAVVARAVPASAPFRRRADDPPHREHVLDADDVSAADALARTLFHRGGGARDEWIALTLQGYDYPSLGRCPALADDGRCSVHALR